MVDHPTLNESIDCLGGVNSPQLKTMTTYEYIGVDKCGTYNYYNIINYYTCAQCPDFYNNLMELRFECL